MIGSWILKLTSNSFNNIVKKVLIRLQRKWTILWMVSKGRLMNLTTITSWFSLIQPKKSMGVWVRMKGKALLGSPYSIRIPLCRKQKRNFKIWKKKFRRENKDSSQIWKRNKSCLKTLLRVKGNSYKIQHRMNLGYISNFNKSSWDKPSPSNCSAWSLRVCLMRLKNSKMILKNLKPSSSINLVKHKVTSHTHSLL